MKRRLISVIFVFCFSSSPAFGSSFLELTCKNDETKGYCMALLRGFLTGYQMGHHSGTLMPRQPKTKKGPSYVYRPVLNPEIFMTISTHICEKTSNS